MPKRPIDLKRDAAGSIQVGAGDDPSRVTGMFPIGDHLHIIKEGGIYEIKLADQIDPDRTNIDVPNTQQRVLSYGSSSELVGRTLLTAKELFNDSYLPKSFDHKEALRLSFEALKDLAVMAELESKLLEDQQAALATVEEQGRGRSLALPSVANMAARCKDFIQKCDHSLQSLLSIIRLFYGRDAGKKWYEGFSDMVSHLYGPDDPFAKFLAAALPFLQFVRNTRNCVEHPKENERLVINDFSIGSDGLIVLPGIEIIHLRTPHPPISAAEFMHRVNQNVIEIHELTIVYICSKQVQPIGGFATQVVELPRDKRRQSHVRYSYGIYGEDGRVIRAS
jgi:hypothetical protein